MNAPIAPLTGIRRCTDADIEWMVEVATTRYPGQFDVEAVKAWGKERLANPQMVFYRGKRSFGACHLANRFNAPSRKQAYLTLLYSIPVEAASLAASREPLRIAEKLVSWAKEQGATKFWFSDMTQTDLGRFAAVLGGKLAGHTYVIDLDGQGTPYG